MTARPDLVARAHEHATHRQWLRTLRTLRQRFREDRLAMIAGSLTFTTLISLVPLVTVMLALFSALPQFSNVQAALQKYFLRTLIPDGIAQAVLGAIGQFASRASRLGSVGLVVLVLSAFALMLTIDRALNTIWRIARPRPIAQRVLIYWAAITLGPLIVGASLTLTSYAVSASRGLVDALPNGFGFLFGGVEFIVGALGFAGLFYYVPHTSVRWRHALAGGLFVAIGSVVLRQLLAFYLGQVSTFAVVYGAFASLPIFLVWIYVSWLIVLSGAVIVAYAPMLHRDLGHWEERPGTAFRIAVAVVRVLANARDRHGGLSGIAIAQALRIDPLQSAPLLGVLMALGWVGRLDEAEAPRYVLLCEPASTVLQPLVERLLLEPAPELDSFWSRARLGEMTLAEATGA